MVLDRFLSTRGLGQRVLRAETMPGTPQTKPYESKHRSRRLPPKHPSEFPSLLGPACTYQVTSSFEIAQRLQAEEEEQERRRIAAEERRRREANGRQPVYASQHPQQPPTSQMANMRISQQGITAEQLAAAGKKPKKDKDCVIM